MKCPDNDVFLAGSTSKNIYVLDRRVHRSGGVTMLLSGDAKMSALVVCRNGIACLSGDSHGAMKLWDLRTRACVETLFNEEGHKPITSLTTSAPPDGILPFHASIHTFSCTFVAQSLQNAIFLSSSR